MSKKFHFLIPKLGLGTSLYRPPEPGSYVGGARRPTADIFQAEDGAQGAPSTANGGNGGKRGA